MDRSAGANLRMKSTGNSRSFWYDATPKVRMSNLVMLPGGRDFESILGATHDGMLIKGMRAGGSNDRTGYLTRGRCLMVEDEGHAKVRTSISDAAGTMA